MRAMQSTHRTRIVRDCSWLGCVLLLVLPQLSPAADTAPARPHITGLSHVALYVHDVDRSRAFYKDFLGFAEPFSLNDTNGNLRLTFIKINDRQYVELFPEKTPASDRLSHIALETDDAEAMRAYLASRGVKVPPKVPKGQIGNLNFNITDPDGHKVEIVQYEPDGWTVQHFGKDLPDTRIAARMSHAGIIVGDVPATLKFYCDILGFQEFWRGSRDGKNLNWINIRVPDGKDYLELMLYGKPPDLAALGGAHHICLEVSDVSKVTSTFATRHLPAGCKDVTPVRTGVNGKRQINCYDPDGTRVEVMEATTADGKPVPPSTAPPPKHPPAATP
jgi:catechol 2,3-dioxygenase-like lactoylglutathione lyase family enzyme